jgi:hypothetical protein
MRSTANAQHCQADTRLLLLYLSATCQTIHAPESEYTSEARGEALWSLELALGLEKLNFGKLRCVSEAVCRGGGGADSYSSRGAGAHCRPFDVLGSVNHCIRAWKTPNFGKLRCVAGSCSVLLND